MKSIQCPFCSAEKIQMVVSGANVYWNLVGLDEHGDPIWEEDSSDGDVEVQYVCSECGHVFPASSEEELVSMLSKEREN